MQELLAAAAMLASEEREIQSEKPVAQLQMKRSPLNMVAQKRQHVDRGLGRLVAQQLLGAAASAALGQEACLLLQDDARVCQSGHDCRKLARLADCDGGACTRTPGIQSAPSIHYMRRGDEAHIVGVTEVGVAEVGVAEVGVAVWCPQRGIYRQCILIERQEGHVTRSLSNPHKNAHMSTPALCEHSVQIAKSRNKEKDQTDRSAHAERAARSMTLSSAPP